MQIKHELYFITDRALSKHGIVEDAKKAISAGGAKILQYREKCLSTAGMIEEAKALRKICKKNRVLFIINDRIDIALAVDADGVHLGQDDMPIEIARRILGKKIIGLTVHTVKEAIAAEKKGADYIAASPIFGTKTKKDAGKSIGTAMLKKIKQNVSIPVVAIGGINYNNLDEALSAGPDAVCIISGILKAGDISKETKKIVAKIKSVKK